MKKEYRKTCWSTEMGYEWIQSYYLQGETDEVEQNKMKKNKKRWKPIEEQVRGWVRQGWAGWVGEKPAWFNDSWKVKVPEEWVPEERRVEWRKARRIHGREVEHAERERADLRN